MALTALEIYKHLPKKNCNECGVPTCLAFAMSLASMKASVEKCPYVSPEAKALLSASAAPPIRLVKFGTGDNEVSIGDETVMFRHEKTFFHPTAISAIVTDDLPHEEIKKLVAEADAICWERIGQIIKLDAVAVKSKTGDAKRFSEAVKTTAASTQRALILMSDDPKMIEAGLKEISSRKPLINCGTETNWEPMVKIAKEHKCPLVIKSDSLESLAMLTDKIKASGFDDMVLDVTAKTPAKTLENLTVARRLTIRKSYRQFSYPVMLSLENCNDEDEAMLASLGIMKYASIIIIEKAQPWKMLPLLTLRQNIFTDPQKPIMVKPSLYEIGKPCADSPLYFTTNFSLTFFTVKGDIEKSKTPSYLLVVDGEGLSVMTAYAANKLTPEIVAEHIKNFEVKSKIKHNRLIIPGMVARMSIKLRELTGMEIIVGPSDSSGIPAFIRAMK